MRWGYPGFAFALAAIPLVTPAPASTRASSLLCVAAYIIHAPLMHTCFWFSGSLTPSTMPDGRIFGLYMCASIAEDLPVRVDPRKI